MPGGHFRHQTAILINVREAIKGPLRKHPSINSELSCGSKMAICGKHANRSSRYPVDMLILSHISIGTSPSSLNEDNLHRVTENDSIN